jgi:hypothetical protein
VTLLDEPVVRGILSLLVAAVLVVLASRRMKKGTDHDGPTDTGLD